MNFIVFFFSLILPVHAVGLAMLESMKKKTGILPVLSIALAFATISLTLIPPETYDLYRHYERIDSLSRLSFIQAISIAEPGYILFHAYAWLINSLGLPKQFFTASIVFTSYFLVLSVFLDLKVRFLNKEKKQTRLIVFCIFWLSIGFVGIASGIRNGFANIIILYVGYQFIYHNKLGLFLIGSISAFFIHPFAALPALLVFLSKKQSRFSKYGKILVFVAIIFLFLSKYTAYIINLFTPLVEGFSFYKGSYLEVDSKWGGGFAETRSINGLIASFVIERLSFYIAMIYLLINKPKNNNPLYLLLCCFALCLGLLFTFYSFFGRMNLIFIYFFSIYISAEYIINKNKINKVFICLFLGALVLHSTFNLYEYRNFLFSSYELLYKPLPLLLFGF